jgi:hypothetical protein
MPNEDRMQLSLGLGPEPTYQDWLEAEKTEPETEPETEVENCLISILLMLRDNRVVPADRQRLRLALAKSEADFAVLRGHSPK